MKEEINRIKSIDIAKDNLIKAGIELDKIRNKTLMDIATKSKHKNKPLEEVLKLKITPYEKVALFKLYAKTKGKKKFLKWSKDNERVWLKFIDTKAYQNVIWGK